MTSLFQPVMFPLFADSRGLLREVFNEDITKSLQIAGFPHALFVQSHANVLRGMHFQLPAQGKYIVVLEGAVHLFGLDLRAASSTYGKMTALPVAEGGAQAWWLPPGCAFGYRTYTKTSLMYFLSEPRSTKEYALNFFDKTWNTFLIESNWKPEQFTMSEKDSTAPHLMSQEGQRITPISLAR